MLPARLLDRCPSARVRGTALAQDFALEFSKPSLDRSGKASLVTAEGAAVPGTLFEIDVAQRDALDRHEGAGHGYKRIDDFAVLRMPSREATLASTYVATATDAGLRPFDWYLAVVIAGALHHEMDAQHITALRAQPYIVDVEQRRPARQRAIDAMLATASLTSAACLGLLPPVASCT